MDENIIIYAKRDKHNSIIHIISSIFINDIREYEIVDKCEKCDDRYIYAHADNGEYIKLKYGKPLFDNDGIPNFKDNFIELTKEQKYNLYIKPNKIAIETKKQEAELNNMMLKQQQVMFLNELPDEEATKIPLMYETWFSFIGKPLKEGKRIEYEMKLWRVRKDIPIVLEDQQPSIETASLYEIIDTEHKGTIDDPIPYFNTMVVYKDKYYIEEDTLYKCIRDSEQPLYATCSSLIGNYFELA